MKIASYNINGINGRIANLLRWLQEAKPDIRMPTGIEMRRQSFSDLIALN